MSLHNLTIGHEDTTAFLYHPTLCNGDGWEVNNQGGASGSYSSCTTGSNKNFTPSANFTFTGVAVYYVSPNFEGRSIRFTLDGGKSVTVNLTHPQDSQATNGSAIPQVVWNATNLENTQHILRLQPGSGGRTLNVDQFIITQVDTNNTISSTPANTTSQSPAGGAASILGLPVQSTKTTRTAIALGSTFGAISFLIFLGITVFLARRTRSLKKRLSWQKPPPIRSQHTGAAVTNTSTHLYSHDDSLSLQSPVTPASAAPEVPAVQIQMRPLPNIAHGSFTTYDLSDDRSDRNTPGAPVGKVSPTQSNTHLLYNRPSTSSHGHGDAVASQSFVRFEPVRSASQSHSVYASQNTDSSPAYSPSPRTRFNNPPSAYSAPPYTVTDNIVNTPSLSRNTTVSSGRLEPVRKGTNTSG